VLGIETTLAFCTMTSGEQARREIFIDGGLFTRIPNSHISVGTFEYFYLGYLYLDLIHDVMKTDNTDLSDETID